MNVQRAQPKTAAIALGVFALALAFRLPFLGRAALWGDEILFVQYMADVSLSPWRAFLDYWQNCIDFGQLPLAGVILNVWMHAAGRFVPDVARHVWALRLPGAVAGGVILGVIEALVSGFFSSTFRDAAAFAILILVLLFKPSGLFGKNTREKV